MALQSGLAKKLSTRFTLPRCPGALLTSACSSARVRPLGVLARSWLGEPRSARGVPPPRCRLGLLLLAPMRLFGKTRIGLISSWFSARLRKVTGCNSSRCQSCCSNHAGIETIVLRNRAATTLLSQPCTSLHAPSFIGAAIG